MGEESDASRVSAECPLAELGNHVVGRFAPFARCEPVSDEIVEALGSLLTLIAANQFAQVLTRVACSCRR